MCIQINLKHVFTKLTLNQKQPAFAVIAYALGSHRLTYEMAQIIPCKLNRHA